MKLLPNMDGATGDMDHNIDILYENTDVVVVNKPAGLMVHHDGKRDEPTLVDWLLAQYPHIKGVGEPLVLSDDTQIDRPGIVHRLDKDTSGVLVATKTQQAFAHLKRQFQEKEVYKTYKAIVYGAVKKDHDTINRPIGRSAQDFRKWSAQRGARGTLREAITTYTVIKRGTDFSVLEVTPQTGRTHQIRVHLKAINHPVVCDTLYAPKQPCALDLQRQALHAATLSFALPSGERITAEAPLPQDIEHAVAQIH